MTTTEQRYRAAVERWSARDLDAATGLLDEALAATSGPGGDPWWFAAARARAQIAMELDDLETAEHHVEATPADIVGSAQQHALRSQLWLLRGSLDAAEVEASAAAYDLSVDVADLDVGALMNGALACGWVADVLAELGLAGDALAMVATGRRWMGVAGIDDEIRRGLLTFAEAAARRLLMELDVARELLDSVDVEVSADFSVLRDRELARLAIAGGDLVEAERRYERAISTCKSMRCLSLERRLLIERRPGPPALRIAHEPLERRWILQLTAGRQEYAVVVSLPFDGSGRTAEVESAVCAVLAERPDLGIVDGTGSDGETWDLVLDGADADALWAAVRPVVARHARAGAVVTIRTAGGVRVERLPPTSRRG